MAFLWVSSHHERAAFFRVIYTGPNTSCRNHLHAVHPYLVGDVEINRPNQVWMVDLTYLRLKGGFMYLVAFIDVHSRYIVSWSLSNTLKKGLTNALSEITNNDQGITQKDALPTT